MRIKLWLGWIVVICFSGTSSAQTYEALLQAGSGMSPDLQFPAEAKELSLFSPMGMAIFKPAGVGPFPAVVLHHTCGGIGSEIRDWTKLAIEKGYVVFVLDSLGPRGLKTNCFPPNPVPTSRGAKDAFQALKHLKTFPFVDGSRVGLVGFSWGAMVGLMVSSNEVARVLSQGERFDAAVSFYPMCYFAGNPKNPAAVEYLRADSDRPLLVLMGDQDNETPPADCLPRLEALKKQGGPVEWHLYASATHCWDCSSLPNFRKIDFQGNTVVYNYSREITADSARRTFEFLAKRMEPRR